MFNMKFSSKLKFSILFIAVISIICGIYIGKSGFKIFELLGIGLVLIISFLIATSLSNGIKKSINRLASLLTETYMNVESITDELVNAGQTLTESTAEEASSIQETSSTLEESVSMIRQTNQNTKEADILAKQAKNAAYQGDTQVNQMLSAMNELKKSSTEISKIIKVIDGIAFQTNLLSLNAAVEAARAGEAGKGFAVVAEEVRNLAQRSALAAKDTSTIIESNIFLSERSVQISEEVSKSLITIKDETTKVSELLEEISTASQEQELGINQINKAISQLEVVVNTNATTAQSSSNSADKLKLYSSQIQNIVQELTHIIEEKQVLVKTPKQVLAKPPKQVAPKKVTPIKKTVSTDDRRVSKPAKKDLDGAKVINPEDIIPLDDF